VKVGSKVSVKRGGKTFLAGRGSTSLRSERKEKLKFNGGGNIKGGGVEGDLLLANPLRRWELKLYMGGLVIL